MRESVSPPEKRAAVFLDRDGVLNRPVVRDGKPYAPLNPEELEQLPGVAEACALLKDAGFLLVMVTNQPEISRGNVSSQAVEQINSVLQRSLGLDSVKLCPHDDSDNCICRKPQPGLLHEAQREFEVDLARSFMVGDRWKDVDAGRRAGCKTIFIDHGYAERRPEAPDFVTNSLLQGVPWILEVKQTNGGKHDQNNI